MASRATRVADLMVEALRANHPPGETPATTIERVSHGRLRDKDYEVSITGRRVLVQCDSYLQADVATRAKDRNAYLVAVCVANRFTTAGPPSEDWLDAEIEWVQEHVYDALSGARKADRPKVLYDAGLWCEEAAVTVLYDDEYLVGHNLFVSVVTFDYRCHEAT